MDKSGETILRLRVENKELREALEKISKRHCGGYNMSSPGYVNGCGSPVAAKRALKERENA